MLFRRKKLLVSNMRPYACSLISPFYPALAHRVIAIMPLQGYQIIKIEDALHYKPKKLQPTIPELQPKIIHFYEGIPEPTFTKK
jgi:hypothetical protein